MKKLILVILLLCSFVFVSCKKDEAPAGDNTGDNNGSQNQEHNEDKKGDQVTQEQLEAMVGNVHSYSTTMVMSGENIPSVMPVETTGKVEIEYNTTTRKVSKFKSESNFSNITTYVELRDDGEFYTITKQDGKWVGVKVDLSMAANLLQDNAILEMLSYDNLIYSSVSGEYTLKTLPETATSISVKIILNESITITTVSNSVTTITTITDINKTTVTIPEYTVSTIEDLASDEIKLSLISSALASLESFLTIDGTVVTVSMTDYPVGNFLEDVKASNWTFDNLHKLIRHDYTKDESDMISEYFYFDELEELHKIVEDNEMVYEALCNETVEELIAKATELLQDPSFFTSIIKDVEIEDLDLEKLSMSISIETAKDGEVTLTDYELSIEEGRLISVQYNKDGRTYSIMFDYSSENTIELPIVTEGE